jgi:hypothetical protein
MRTNAPRWCLAVFVFAGCASSTEAVTLSTTVAKQAATTAVHSIQSATPAPSAAAPAAPAVSSNAVSSNAVSSNAVSSSFTAEVWADNWFSLYVNGTLVGEDSVPITTERSFNAETITFNATYPLSIAMITCGHDQRLVARARDPSGADQQGVRQIGDRDNRLQVGNRYGTSGMDRRNLRRIAMVAGDRLHGSRGKAQGRIHHDYVGPFREADLVVRPTERQHNSVAGHGRKRMTDEQAKSRCPRRH